MSPSVSLRDVSNEFSQLLQLPRELLIAIFKAQDTILAVLRLSRTCRSLHHVWLANSRAIADEVVPMEIACYQDALRLAQAQDTVGSTKARPTSGIKDTSVPLKFNQNYLSRLYANAHEADCVCQFATLHLVGALQSSKPGGDTSNCADYRCSFLPLHILPRQREHMIHCWYFIKLCTLSYLWSSLCRSRDSILRDMEVIEVWAVGTLMNFVCEEIEEDDQEKLGIWDEDPQTEVQAPMRVPAWYQARDFAWDAFWAKPYSWQDEHELMNFCPCGKYRGIVCGVALIPLITTEETLNLPDAYGTLPVSRSSRALLFRPMPGKTPRQFAF